MEARKPKSLNSTVKNWLKSSMPDGEGA